MMKPIAITVLLTCSLVLSTFAQTNIDFKVLHRVYGDKAPPEEWRRISAARTYLAKTQNQDGSWGEENSRISETPLALIGFTNGNVPGNFQSNVVRGVEWLIKSETPTDPDIIAIRIIAAAELIHGGEYRQTEILAIFIRKEMQALKKEPNPIWRDLLSIAHLPKDLTAPDFIPKSWATTEKYLNKNMQSSDVEDVADLRVFILKTFVSSSWSASNSKAARRAAWNLWKNQSDDGSFPELKGHYGKAGAVGLMFLQNKTWMHVGYVYLGEERQRDRKDSLTK